MHPRVRPPITLRTHFPNPGEDKQVENGMQLSQTRCRGGLHSRRMSQAEIAEKVLRHHKRFELLRKLHKVRDFRLTLSATVTGHMGEYPVQILKRVVAEKRQKRGLTMFFPYHRWCTIRIGTKLVSEMCCAQGRITFDLSVALTSLKIIFLR